MNKLDGWMQAIVCLYDITFRLMAQFLPLLTPCNRLKYKKNKPGRETVTHKKRLVNFPQKYLNRMELKGGRSMIFFISTVVRTIKKTYIAE